MTDMSNDTSTVDTQAPHWTQVLQELWERADEETFEIVNIPDYAEENGYDPEKVKKTLEVKPAWNYIEYGVGPNNQWFHSEFDASVKTERDG
jgi:hypothetical protein